MAESVKVLNKSLSEGKVDVVEPTKTTVLADGTIVVKYRCRYCGKWILRDENVEAGSGDYCRHLREEEGYTEADLQEHRKSMTATEVPVATDGRAFIKIAAVHRLCDKHGIAVSRLVKAFGGDRGLEDPLDPRFRPIYVGKARYIDPWCGDEEGGLKFLRSMSGRVVPLKESKPANGKKATKGDGIEDALS